MVAMGPIFLFWLLLSLAMFVCIIVFTVAHWKLMRAHETISNTLEIIAERMSRKAS